MSIAITYTTDQINNALNIATKRLGQSGYRNALIVNYGIDKPCEDYVMFKWYIAVKILSRWQQDFWGDTTNYTNYNTRADITKVVDWINKNKK